MINETGVSNAKNPLLEFETFVASLSLPLTASSGHSSLEPDSSVLNSNGNRLIFRQSWRIKGLDLTLMLGLYLHSGKPIVDLKPTTSLSFSGRQLSTPWNYLPPLAQRKTQNEWNLESALFHHLLNLSVRAHLYRIDWVTYTTVLLFIIICLPSKVLTKEHR